MDAQQVLVQLQKLGKANTVTIYARHGVTGPCYGVSYADLKPLVKKIGRNHDVAAGLWASGVHDARVVATMIAEPEKMTRAEIERWLSECTNYVITDAVAGLAAKMADGLVMARAWIDQDSEWVTSAGWSVVASNGSKGTIAAGEARGMLDRIERGIHEQPNRTRHAMNSVLISMGGYVDAMRPRVLEVAKAIGTVHVDHGETGCTTPDASAYIAKMVAHRAAKTAPRAAKPTARKPRVSVKAKASARRPKRTTARKKTKSRGKKTARPR